MKEFIDNLINSSENSPVMTILAGGIILFLILLNVICIISFIKVLKKVNMSNSNIIWYFLPILGPIILVIRLNLTKNFNKGTGFMMGAIILPIIFIPLLAFSEDSTSNLNDNNTNNTFDATNVINNNVQANEVDLNNQVKTIEPSIPENINIETEVNPLPTAPIAEPTIENNLNTPIEPTIDVEPVVEGIQENVEPLNNIPQYEPTINNLVEEPKEVVIPTIDNVNIKEPVENIEVNVEPVIPTAPVVEESVPNAFNSTPIMTEPVNNNTVTETLETTPNIESEQNVVSEPVSEDVINEPIIDVTNNVIPEKKVCKNCGNELPNIVSICPNCGTDNE